jgi:hypothetical protein
MQYYDIEPDALKEFKTVDEILDVIPYCKSNNATNIIFSLVDGASIYDFMVELNNHPNTEDYVILTRNNGENEYGIVDGVKDLTSFALEDYEFDPHTSIEEIVKACREEVHALKHDVGIIDTNTWFELDPLDFMDDLIIDQKA